MQPSPAMTGVVACVVVDGGTVVGMVVVDSKVKETLVLTLVGIAVYGHPSIVSFDSSLSQVVAYIVGETG